VSREPIETQRDLANAGRGLNGVYTSVPAELPSALHDCDVVVGGGSFDVALQLAAGCASVTYITTRTTRIRKAPENVRIHYGSEIACIDGVTNVESVIVRKRSNGAITACTAAALFLIAE
jgi:hypothetical protein